METKKKERKYQIKRKIKWIQRSYFPLWGLQTTLLFLINFHFLYVFLFFNIYIYIYQYSGNEDQIWLLKGVNERCHVISCQVEKTIKKLDAPSKKSICEKKVIEWCMMRNESVGFIYSTKFNHYRSLRSCLLYTSPSPRDA